MPILPEYLDSSDGKYVVADFASTLERSFNPHNDRSLRVPFYLTSEYRQKRGVKGVSMLMNPSSVAFKQTKRITEQETQGGRVYYHWTNRLGRDNSVLELEFSGQTGNISLRGGTVQRGLANAIFDKYEEGTYKHGKRAGEERTSFMTRLNNLAESNSKVDSTSLGVVLAPDSYVGSGAAKLANFWNLYSLTREPVVDPLTGRGVNYFISYSSPTFGNTFITFVGHFNRVLDFTDDANNPNSVKYNFGFTVKASHPSMDDIFRVATQNLSTLFSNPMDTYTEDGRK